MGCEYSSHENVWCFEAPHGRATCRVLVLGIVNWDLQLTSKGMAGSFDVLNLRFPESIVYFISCTGTEDSQKFIEVNLLGKLTFWYYDKI